MQLATSGYFLKFREKSLRLFVFGDYELLCNLYGISGASGEYIARVQNF